jgi:class 3 adenylate cyclase
MPDESQHPTSQRKNATVLFADLSGFTAMSANLDPEEVRDIVNRYFEALSTAVRSYEGSIDKYIGDCVMAVFGVPATHENDAERACRAALDMRLAVRDLASGFGSEFQAPDIHIGINTGLVVAAPMGSGDSSQFTVMGDAVNLASRLCHEAENGQIAVGESTWAQVAQDFDFAARELRSIKGKTEKVPVFLLRGRSQNADRDKTRTQPAMVGRVREIALAQDLLADAQNKCGALLYITGEPGIGKSRLSAEISKWATANRYRVLAASAQPLAAIEPYSLWRQALEQLIGITPGVGPAEADHALENFMKSGVACAQQGGALRATLGLPTSEFELLDDAGRLESISRGWKTVLYGLEAEAPLLVVLDDLQWADGPSLRLLDQVFDSVAGHAVVLCCLARPEFEHSWASRSSYHRISLRPLSPQDSAILARDLLKECATSDSAQLIARAEGNPFYLTELAHAETHRGEAELPATIEGLILARIDRLEQKSRRILELASVIGREFPERLLRAVGDTDQFEPKIRHLLDLEFIYEKEIAPDLLYLFKHYLTQEATYNSILIQKRKEMHRKVASAIENIYKDSLDRYNSVLAQHYEKAAEYQRAFECYRLAGDKAQATTSVSAAAQLYERSETALQMDRPVLRNKWKYFAISGGICLVLFIALGWIARVLDSHFDLLVYSAISGIELVILFGMIVLWFQRWSFLIYQDRIRIRSKRRIVDIPFERITGIQIVSSRGWAPRAHWTFFRTCLDPRYPKYGWGQIRVMGGLREIIRINCAHGKWRKGYHLDMDEPQSFLLTLNRALQRSRVIQSPKLTGPSRQ